MTVYFARLKVGHPEPQQEPPSNAESWKVYTICTDSSKASCSTRADVALIKGNADRGSARNAYQGLQKRAAIGLPLKDQYDEKACHESHSFVHNEHEHKIYRLRKEAIRVYFLYLNEKKILLLKTLVKRKGNLSQGEKDQISEIGKVALNCIDEHGFSARELK